MEKKWSKSWKSSKQPRKQRKYGFNAPLHVRAKKISANLSKELRKKYSKRTLPLRTGDRIKVLRGSHKGTLGKVEGKDLTNYKIFIKGVERKKKDGTSNPIPVDPSNVQILELNLEDKKRKQKLEKRNESSKKPSSA